MFTFSRKVARSLDQIDVFPYTHLSLFPEGHIHPVYAGGKQKTKRVQESIRKLGTGELSRHHLQVMFNTRELETRRTTCSQVAQPKSICILSVMGHHPSLVELGRRAN